MSDDIVILYFYCPTHPLKVWHLNFLPRFWWWCSHISQCKGNVSEGKCNGGGLRPPAKGPLSGPL